MLIEGLEKPNSSIVFHAGTKLHGSRILTNGGRVLAVTSLGENVESALKTSYQTVSQIKWSHVNFRPDIGKDLLIRSNNSV